MLFEPTFKLRQATEEEFIGFESKEFMEMDLGRHFQNQLQGQCQVLTDRKQNLALDIIGLLLSRRKHLKLPQLIEKEKYIPDIEEKIKARNIEAKPIVKFQPSKPNGSDSSSSETSEEEPEDSN